LFYFNSPTIKDISSWTEREKGWWFELRLRDYKIPPDSLLKLSFNDIEKFYEDNPPNILVTHLQKIAFKRIQYSVLKRTGKDDNSFIVMFYC